MHVVLILMDRGNLSPLEQFNKMKAPLIPFDFFGRPADDFADRSILQSSKSSPVQELITGDRSQSLAA
jgi:hypothetical protein